MAFRNLIRLVGWVAVGLGTVVQAGDAPNLVVNGDFSQAAKDKGQAVGWSRLDGITSLVDANGHPGGCLRLDTSVLQVDKKKFEEALASPAKGTGRGGGSPYATVGAHEGAWAFSAPVAMAADAQYFMLEADVKGPERSTSLFYPQVFVRGYRKYNPERDGETSAFFQTPHEGGPAYSEQFGKEQRPAVAGDYLMVYRHSLVCRLEAKDTWYHFRLGFSLPKMAKYRPEVLLLKLYAMWPLGNYYFDNIVLRAATKEEVDQAAKAGHSAKGFMPGE